MKSFFKRTLAAASGSILALSQLSAVAATVNVNAVDEASAASSKATVDKEFVLFVPIDEENPTQGLHSDWNDKLEGALLAAGDKSFTVSPELGKEKAKRIMLQSDRIDSATADDILAAVSDVTVKTTSDGKVTAEFQIADIGQIVGGLIEQEMRIQNDEDKDTVGGKPVVADWTKLTMTCKALVEAETDFENKKVSYKVTLTDENGKKYTDYKGVEEYVLAKVDEAAQLLKDAAAKNDGNTAKFNAKLDKFVQKAKNGEGFIKAMVEAVNKLSASASDLDTLYTDYTAKLVEAAKGINAPAYYTDAAVSKFNETKPASASQFWTDERTQAAYDKAVSIVNTNFGEFVDVQLKLSDIQGIVDSATSAEYSIDGYSAEAILTIPDDKEAEVKAAVEKYCAENNAKLVSFSSSKKITANVETEYGMKGSAFYDVERIITVETEPITTTTTAPVVTTSDESTTTTTVPVSETTVPVSETTEPVSETTAPVTDVTTTVPDPTTTPATYVSFEFDGIEDEGLVYWSEEDGEFDLSNLSVSLHFYEAGIEQVSKTVEVTNAFKPEATKPSDLTMPKSIGCAAQTVYFKLTDEAAVQQAILDAGYDQALIEQEGIKNGKEAGKFTVYLVLRGDTDLSGHVDVIDAQLALIYYTHTSVALKDVDKVFEETIYLKSQGEYEKAYFPYSHYAMDVWDGNGIISVEDAQGILKYYTNIDVALKEGITWDSKEVVGKKIVPLDELHREPLARDTYATKYVGMRNPLKEEG